MARITILGGGSWGTALAKLIGENGHEVMIWCYEKDVVNSINQHHENKEYLNGHLLPKTVQATESLEKACAFSTFVFEAVPVAFLRSVLTDAKKFITKNHRWIITSKGIEQKTLFLPTALIDDVFSSEHPYAVLSGPSFAKDLAEKMPTCVVLASSDQVFVKALSDILTNAYFTTEYSDDPLGIQVCGALKNVVTLAIGFLRGAGYRDNTCAALFTKSMHDLYKIIEHRGGKKESAYGLAGMGDLVLTSWGAASRNKKAGELTGKGFSVDEIKKKLSVLPEGFNTVESIEQLCQQAGLELPFFQGVHEVIEGNLSIDLFVERFMRG